MMKWIMKENKMDIAGVLSNFEDDVQWLDISYEQLKDQFDEKWIAVFDRQVVDHDINLERLMGRLETKFPKDFRNMVLEFITKKKVEMIL